MSPEAQANQAMKNHSACVFWVSILLSSPLAFANDLYVDALLGDDSLGNGTATAPYQTITHALGQLSGAGPNTVHVAPGVYNQSLGENFPLVLGSRVRLLGAGAYQCVLSGGGGDTLLRLGRDAVVSDFTLRRGGVAVVSQGLGFQQPELRLLQRIIIQDSLIGIQARDDLHSDHGLVLLNSLLIRNGIAVQLISTGNDFQSITLAVHGSTITGNGQWLSTQGFGELYQGILGSIVYGNGNDTIASYPLVFPAIQGNLLGDPSWNGIQGNLFAAPLLADVAKLDGHLKAASPALDWASGNLPWPPAAQWVPPSAWTHAGSYAATLDLGGNPRLVGAASDAGAYERAVPTLYSAGGFELGTTLQLQAQAEPGDNLLLGLSLDLLPIQAFDFLWLAEPIFLLGSIPTDGDGLGSFHLNLPNNPSAVGLWAYFQTVKLSPSAALGSNPLAIRLSD